MRVFLRLVTSSVLWTLKSFLPYRPTAQRKAGAVPVLWLVCHLMLAEIGWRWVVEGPGIEKKRRKKFSAIGRQLGYAQLRKVWKHGKANEENLWR